MLMRRVFVSEFDLSDAYLAELKDLGVRVALRNEDGSFLYCGVLMQTFPAKATCFVVREDVIDEAVLKATAAVIWIGKARKASEKLDLVPLPSAAQVGAEVFDLAFASIYTGGPKRWTVGQEVDWERQIGALKEFGLDCADVVIPFAGDVPFAAHASARSVTVVEWSKVALDKLKTRFPEQKVPDNVHLIQAEWFSWAEKIEAGRFSLAFDKDAFGFCNPDSRTKYAESVSRLICSNGIVYMEVKERKADKEEGPPFHIAEETILTHWRDFEIAKRLGVVLEYTAEGFLQMGYVLRKKK